VRIRHTAAVARHPWPEGTFLQGGERGLVLTVEGSYRTAFVEGSPPDGPGPGTFLRGEGATLSEAEDACWARYQAIVTCPAHPSHGPFERRHYRNGAGFCERCGSWFSRVLPPLGESQAYGLSALERALTDVTGEAAVELLRRYAAPDDEEPTGDPGAV